MWYYLSSFFLQFSRKRRLCVLQRREHYCKRWYIWWKRNDRRSPVVAARHDGQSGDHGYQCDGQDQRPQDFVGRKNIAFVSCGGREYKHRWEYRPGTVSNKTYDRFGLHSKFGKHVCDALRMLFTKLFQGNVVRYRILHTEII